MQPHTHVDAYLSLISHDTMRQEVSVAPECEEDKWEQLTSDSLSVPNRVVNSSTFQHRRGDDSNPTSNATCNII